MSRADHLKKGKVQYSGSAGRPGMVWEMELVDHGADNTFQEALSKSVIKTVWEVFRPHLSPHRAVWSPTGIAWITLRDRGGRHPA